MRNRWKACAPANCVTDFRLIEYVSPPDRHLVAEPASHYPHLQVLHLIDHWCLRSVQQSAMYESIRILRCPSKHNMLGQRRRRWASILCLVGDPSLFKSNKLFITTLIWSEEYHILEIFFQYTPPKNISLSTCIHVPMIQGSKLARPIVRDDQQSGKDEFSFTELVLPKECPCLTIITKDKWNFWKGLVNFLASSPTGQVEIESNFEPCDIRYFQDITIYDITQISGTILS